MFVEHRNGKLASSTLNAITAAQKLGGSVTALVAGSNPDAVAQSVAKIAGISKVLVSKNDQYEKSLPETLAPLLAETTKKGGYTHLVASHSAVGKNVMPRVAALLDVAQVSDITAIEGEDTFQRTIYAG